VNDRIVYVATVNVPAIALETPTVVGVDGGGSGHCYSCNGRCEYTWVATYSDGTTRPFCSNDVPSVTN